jgi:predicted O-linked N-acetylglucosamine transferase (SPINDLY family)
MTNREQILQQARAALGAGRPDRASLLCTEILRESTRDIEARHLLGRCLAALGRFDDAIGEFRAVLRTEPQFYGALVDLGVTLASGGAYQESRRLLEQARSLDDRPADLHFGLGLCALGMGDLGAAEGAFRAALSRNPNFPDAYNNLGVIYDRLGRLPEAIESFRHATRIRPDYVTGHLNLGDGLLRLARCAEAAEAYRNAVALQPSDASIHADLGAALLAAKDYTAASAALERALSLNPQLAGATANLGEALRNLGATEQAAAAFRRALTMAPEMAEAHLGLGRVAASLGHASEALQCLQAAARAKRGDGPIALTIAGLLEPLGYADQALAVLGDCAALNPHNADLQDALGELRLRTGNPRDALECFERSLTLDPNRARSWLNCGRAQETLGSYEAAIACVERAARLAPGDSQADALLASCAFRICDWSLADRSVAELRASAHGIDQLHPFLLLAADLEPAAAAESLRRRGRALARPATMMQAARHAHDRLRIAYLSPDFREHAVAHALAGVIERHDRQRFRSIGISLTTPSPGGVGLRLQSAFEEFLDASTMSDRTVAEWMRQHEVDVAVDLAGYTSGARPAIFGFRAAVAQVNYLGFPGSTGRDCIDFIIADDVIVPPSDESQFTERVLRMPHCYLPFDDARSAGDVPMSRREAGLPQQAFVFCAFSNGYKIARPLFEIWMSLLRELPQSVLWLRNMGPAAAANLQSAAVSMGVAAERLIFAPFIECMDSHLARLHLADVFLDTRPYNAHTTAAEALWADLPVITCPGGRFAGRVGASVLHAAGLDELICADLPSYRAHALRLARSPELLRNLREKIAALKSTAPLFDTLRYTRDLESTLTRAWRDADA